MNSFHKKVIDIPGEAGAGLQIALSMTSCYMNLSNHPKLDTRISGLLRHAP